LKGEKVALILCEKLTCLPTITAGPNIIIKVGTLKPKITPLWLKHIPQAEQEKLLLPLCPFICTGVDYKIDLLQEIKTRDTDK
jgi:hypothetical protein